MSAADYMDLGKAPVRADAPGGDPCRDDPDFESLQLEIRKLELATGVQPDWAMAVELGSRLLRTKSKDLLVAAWLSIALLQREGYSGFEAGLTILRDLVDLHWDVSFPEIKRIKGRIAAIEWMIERGTREVGRRNPSTSERETVGRCIERLKELDDKLSEKIEGGGPAPGELKRALESAASSVAAPPPPTASAPSVSAQGAGPTTISSSADIPQVLNNARGLLRSAADFLRQHEPANPLAYRLSRIAAWMHLVGVPPNQDGLTQIPAPQPPDSGEKIEQMLAAGQWAGVLEQTESRLTTAVFWLDLQRYAAQALEGLDPSHQPCVQAVIEETALLLRRFPTLKELRFKEGAPLANPATVRWLNERVLAGGGDAAADTSTSGSSAANEELEGLAESSQKARQLVQQRRLSEALNLLEEGARSARTLRARAWWKLEIARACLSQNLVENAMSLLDGLDEELNRARAEDWDPILCVELLKSLFQSHQKVISSLRPIPPEELQRSRLLLGRLSRLDVVAALAFEPKR